MNSYWLGPYGILVHNSIKSVLAADGINIQYRDGTCTRMCIGTPLMTEERYKEQFAELRDDGHYYYVMSFI